MAASNSEHGDNAIASDSSLSPLIMFAAKTIIVVSVCTTAVLVSSSYLSRRFLDVVNQTTDTFKAGSLMDVLEHQLDRLSTDSRLTPERQQRFLIKLRTVSDKWKPFLAEVYATVSTPPPARDPSKSP